MSAPRRNRLLEVALRFGPREFRDGYRRQFYGDVAATRPPLREAIDVARAGLAIRFEGLWRDAGFAVRSLVKTPAFTIVALITLALAISVNATVFGAIETVLFQPLPFAQADRLVFLCPGTQSAQAYRNCNQLGNIAIGEVQRQSAAFSGVAAYQVMAPTLTGHGPPQALAAAWVSTNYFQVLKLRPELGRILDVTDGTSGLHNVVISDELWRRAFGSNPHIVGRSIVLDGVASRVVGVAPPDAYAPTPYVMPGRRQFFDVYQALPASSFRGNPELNDWAFARLAPGVTIHSARADVGRVTGDLVRNDPGDFKGLAVSAVPFSEYYFRTARALLLLAMASVFAVLLIACANVANLLLARGLARVGEIAVRSALGATRARILQRMTVETVLLATAGGALGLLLAWAEIHALVMLAPTWLFNGTAPHITGHTVLFTVVVVLIAALAAGVAPAIYSTRRNLQGQLGGAGRGADSSPAKALRATLATVQIALALAVLTASGLLYRSFLELATVPPGIDATNVYVAVADLFAPRYNNDAARAAFIANALKRVRAIPGVESAAIARPIPYSDMGGELFGFRVAGRTYRADRFLFAVGTKITPGYFRTLRIPLVRGRTFTAADNAASQSVTIVERSFAQRFLGQRDPIGTQLLLPSSTGSGGVPATIVGVVASVNDGALPGSGSPAFYVPQAQRPSQIAQIVVRTNRPIPNLRRQIVAAVAATDPLEAIESFYSLQDRIATRWAPQRAAADLVALLAAIALLLALAGVYAIVSYSVERRRHELGIRMAVGAQRAAVMRSVVRTSFGIAIAGVALGVVLAALGSRLVSGLLLGVSAFDALTFAAVIALLLFSVLLATTIPAMFASRLDPAVALRYE